MYAVPHAGGAGVERGCGERSHRLQNGVPVSREVGEYRGLNVTVVELDHPDAMGLRHTDYRLFEGVQHRLNAAPPVGKLSEGHAVSKVEGEHYLQVKVLRSIHEVMGLGVVYFLPVQGAGAHLEDACGVAELRRGDLERVVLLVANREHDLHLAGSESASSHFGEAELDRRCWGRSRTGARGRRFWCGRSRRLWRGCRGWCRIAHRSERGGRCRWSHSPR